MEYQNRIYTAEEQRKIYNCIANWFAYSRPNSLGAKTNKHLMAIKIKMQGKKTKGFTLTEKQISSIDFALRMFGNN